jgi:hypothetical protein
MKIIEINVPDSFTADDILYVKSLANVAKQRIIEKPLIPPTEQVEIAKKLIDDCRAADGLPKQFEKPVKEEEVLPKDVPQG